MRGNMFTLLKKMFLVDSAKSSNRVNCFGPSPGFKTDSCENSQGQMNPANILILALVTVPLFLGRPFCNPLKTVIPKPPNETRETNVNNNYKYTVKSLSCV